MSGGMMLSLLESCGTTKILDASIDGSDMIVSLKDFETRKNNRRQFKKYLVLQNEILQYPICVYRFDENNYQALLMRCTHQGTELQVFGDKLQCPAHGSEFNNKGRVTNGPADNSLRTFPVTATNNELFIDLRKQS